MYRSVRGRITLVATAVVALALLLASVLIIRMVESDLLAATERALAAELELEATTFDFEGDAQFFEFDSNGDFYGLGVFLEDEGFAFGSIFDPITGEPVAEVVIDTLQAEVADIFDPSRVRRSPMMTSSCPSKRWRSTFATWTARTATSCLLVRLPETRSTQHCPQYGTHSSSSCRFLLRSWVC